MQKRITIKLFILFIATFSTLSAHAVEDTVFYNCFVSGNMEKWAIEMEKLEKMAGVNENFERLQRLAFAQYGYVGFLLKEDRSKEAKPLLQQLEQNIGKLEQMQPKNAEILALYGACFGMKIELQKWKAPSYGMKSMSYINDAMEMDSLSAYVLMEKSNMTYHMPSVFGGGVKNAIPVLRNAILKMEASPDQLPQSWLCLLSKATLGKWYFEIGDKDKAMKIFQELLQEEPTFIWVRHDLLPLLEKQ